MTYCPINPKDFINAPAGAFAKAVREYDPDWGRNPDQKKEFTIEFDEVTEIRQRYRAVVSAYSYQEAVKKIELADCDVDFEEIRKENDCYHENYKIIETQEE